MEPQQIVQGDADTVFAFKSLFPGLKAHAFIKTSTRETANPLLKSF